jgi:hypothetical protein
MPFYQGITLHLDTPPPPHTHISKLGCIQWSYTIYEFINSFGLWVTFHMVWFTTKVYIKVSWVSNFGWILTQTYIWVWGSMTIGPWAIIFFDIPYLGMPLLSHTHMQFPHLGPRPCVLQNLWNASMECASHTNARHYHIKL